ncbi:MAG: bacillithiol biosynthesis cysteine-adding enzyme BshC [Flavobacteriales bacterium]|nr:bacillithiol biosynthesis cysteine-adding enzyme BshC [Flavobacteriales bacterium]
MCLNTSALKRVDSIIPKLPKLVQDYLDRSEALAEFTQFSPDMAGLKAAWANRMGQNFDRSILIEVLNDQSRSSSYSNGITEAQINRLSDPKTVTITTGHQLCVYGGPLFFFYKIVSAIKLAQVLKDQGISAIPIYWMASEDHDFEEINHVFIGGTKSIWKTEQSGAVGHMKLGELDAFKKEIREYFNDDHRYKESLDALDTIFGSDRSLSSAIRDFVYWVFADSGVIVIDADDSRLKRVFVPYIQKELTTQFSQNELEKTTSLLESMDYNGQVNGREINLFWLESGYRDRIVKAQVGYATSDGTRSWSKDELLSLVESKPECFSPNVILRPLYQEVILPNIAYIGGPGETSYWLQLRDVFKSANCPMPVILLRDMFALVSEKAMKKVAQLGLSLDDVYKDREAVVTELIRAIGSNEHLVQEKRTQIDAILRTLIAELGELDSTLGQSTEAESTRMSKRLVRLEKKVLRSDKQRNGVVAQRFDFAANELLPAGTPQERRMNWLNYFSDPTSVLDLLEHANPLHPSLDFIQVD